MQSYCINDPVDFIDPYGNRMFDKTVSGSIPPDIAQQFSSLVSNIHGSGINHVDPEIFTPLVVAMGINSEFAGEILKTRDPIEINRSDGCSGEINNEGDKEFRLDSGSEELGGYRLPLGADVIIEKNISVKYNISNGQITFSNIRGLRSSRPFLVGGTYHVNSVTLNTITGETTTILRLGL